MEQTDFTRQEADSLIASTILVICAYVNEQYWRVRTVERTTEPLVTTIEKAEPARRRARSLASS